MAEQDATIAEGDERDDPASDNSIGRLLALSDGVFAIAMTLLALDLRLPDLGADASDAQLREAIGDDWRAYLAFVISFYVVANYWGVHRRTMRAVTTIDAALISHTFPLLLLVAALPFPASVLATYGDLPTALAFYCAFNVVANLALIRVLIDVQTGRGTRPTSSSGSGCGRTSWSCWCASRAPSCCRATGRGSSCCSSSPGAFRGSAGHAVRRARERRLASLAGALGTDNTPVTKEELAEALKSAWQKVFGQPCPPSAMALVVVLLDYLSF